MSLRIDSIIAPRWVLRMTPGARAEEGLAIAVDKGRILAIEPAEQLKQRFTPGAYHSRPDHLLMPGLVNSHCHAGMALMRGFADDLPLEQWLGERIWPTESRFVTPEFVADGTRLGIAEMLLSGVTCFADMYYFPDVVADVAQECGMRASVGMIALEFPTAWAQNADEYISKGLAVHDALKSQPLVSTTFAPHAPYSVADETLSRIRKLADELEVPVHTHVHETSIEIAEAVAKTGMRPLKRLDGLGLVTSALMAVHGTQLDDEEIERLGEAQASVVHCPRSNMKLASGACPVADLLAAGVNVALGTDGAASNNRLDLWSEMQMAALLAKHESGNATAVPAGTAVEMATINGARALGLADEIGSIEVGKLADLICIDLGGVGQRPVFDPVSHLVYCVEREQVDDVWIAGEHLVCAHELTRLDRNAIQNVADNWAYRLMAAT